MTLTAITSFESARRKFFMNSNVHDCLHSRNKMFLGSGGQNEFNRH